MTEKDLYATKCVGKSQQNLADSVAQVDYVTSQMKEKSLPSERARFDWFYKEVQECSVIRRHIEAIRDVDSDDEVNTAKLKNYTSFRKKIVKELSHLQVQKNDAATKDGQMNAPIAINDAKDKAEAARQDKENKKRVQENLLAPATIRSCCYV